MTNLGLAIAQVEAALREPSTEAWCEVTSVLAAAVAELDPLTQPELAGHVHEVLERALRAVPAARGGRRSEMAGALAALRVLAVALAPPPLRSDLPLHHAA